MSVAPRSARQWSLVRVLAILIFLTLLWSLPLVVSRQTVAAAPGTTLTTKSVSAPAENLASAALKTRARSVLCREELHSPGDLPESLASTSPATASNSLPISLVEPVYSRQTITEYLRTHDNFERISPSLLTNTDSLWGAWGGTILHYYPEAYTLTGVPTNVIDGQDDTLFGITWLTVTGGIHGPELHAEKYAIPPDGVFVREIEVLFSVAEGPIEDVDLTITYLIAGASDVVTVEKEDVLLQDGDVFQVAVWPPPPTGGSKLSRIFVTIDAIEYHDINALNNLVGFAEIKTIERVLMELGPLEQPTLLNYTTLKGIPQQQLSRTIGVWPQEITSTWSTTVTVPVTNTGDVTATEAVITLTVPGELLLLPDPGCVTCPLESRALGNVAPGKVITAQWLVATMWPTNTATPTDYAWPVSFRVGGGNVRAVEAADQIGAEIVYDSGYEMGRNAYYPINNPSCAYSECVGPIDWSDTPQRWDIFRDVFSKEILPSSYPSGVMSLPFFKEKWFFDHLYPMMFGAYCTGMSVSNGDRLSGCANLPSCGTQDLWMWSQQPSNETIFREEMEKYQGKMWTEETLVCNAAQMALAEVMPPDDRNNAVFEDIRDTVVSNSTDRRVLTFLPKLSELNITNVITKLGEAHTVVPYMTTESAVGKRIYIYDPNKPYRPSTPADDSINAVQINSEGLFHYDNFFDDPDNWTTGEITSVLVTAPYSFDRDAGLLPYRIFGILSPAHLAVTDDQGRTTGISAGGCFLAEIPSSGPVLGVPKEIYFISPEETPHAMATIRGAGEGTYTYFQFQGDGLFRIQDASVTATSVDTLDVSADGLALRYSTDDVAKTYSAVMVKEVPNHSRIYTAAHTSLAAGEVVTFQIGTDLSTFTYVNPGGVKEYELGLEQTGIYSGAVVFPNLEIGANEVHIISVEDWDHLRTTHITLNVDEGNDGSIDRAIVLQQGVIFADDFDRADSTDLGLDWVEVRGDWDISDGQLHIRTNGRPQIVATSSTFTETRFTIETQVKGIGHGARHAYYYTLFFGANSRGRKGYGVVYEHRHRRLSLVRHHRRLDTVSIRLQPDTWYGLQVVRDGETGLIQVYLDQGEGYGEDPILEASDTTYPMLGRLGWLVRSREGDFYVDWLVVR